MYTQPHNPVGKLRSKGITLVVTCGISGNMCNISNNVNHFCCYDGPTTKPELQFGDSMIETTTHQFNNKGIKKLMQQALSNRIST